MRKLALTLAAAALLVAVRCNGQTIYQTTNGAEVLQPGDRVKLPVVNDPPLPCIDGEVIVDSDAVAGTETVKCKSGAWSPLHGPSGPTGATGSAGGSGPTGPSGPAGSGGGGYVHVALLADAVGVTMTNPPASGAEPANNITRRAVDFTGHAQWRGQFIASTASALIVLRVQYAAAPACATWTNLGSDVVGVATANALTVGAWGAIPAAAQGDVCLRALVVGNGALDPILRAAAVEAK